jgi:S1-C subfamily serine protease
VNVLDVAFVVLIVVAAFAGFRSGALPQLGGLLGAAGGAGIALFALPHLLDPLQTIDPPLRAFVVLVGLLGAVGIGEAIGSAVGLWAARGLGAGVLGALDRLAGGLIGIAQGILVVWLAGGLLAAGPIPRLASFAQTSSIVRGVDAFLPPPTEVAADLSRLLDASGLPDVFVGLEPLPAAPVELPSDPEAKRIGELATASTVKVTSAACGLLLTGTGVVIGQGYVVTNAHVVAGSRSSRITSAADVLDGTVVLFDPELDVALLWVPRLSARAMRFANADPTRGSVGAALGYPLGGPLTVVAAAVGRDLQATGLDIYDNHRVTRDVLELHAQIDRGDSGGPFVLRDGTIGGLVFAEARSDNQVGYALSPVSVASGIQPGIGRTGAVSTGDCVR